MNKNLLIWGKGAHANVIVEQCRYGNYRMVDDNSSEFRDGSWLSLYPKEKWDAFVAIGDNHVREKIFDRLRDKGYGFANVVSRDAYVSPTVVLGVCIYIAPMACVMTHTILDDGCIINTNASVDHDCNLGKFVHISPCAGLGGTVVVGDRTWIGLGSAVNHGTRIAKDVVVGSGSSVIDNIESESSLFAGNPAVFKKNLR